MMDWMPEQKEEKERERKENHRRLLYPPKAAFLDAGLVDG